MKTKSKKIKYGLMVLTVLLATTFILWSIFDPSIKPQVFTCRYGTLINHQLIMLSTALFVFLMTIILFGKDSLKLMSLKKRDGVITPVKALGINPKKNETWKNLGLQMALIITIITSIVIYIQVAQDHSFTLNGSLILVVILALSNALSEEIIFRFSLVAGGKKLELPHYISEISSAIIFGAAHYFGNPGGIPGVLMAAFIGWFLAKSINETEGFFWALFIHFLQDVVIFYALIIAMS